ncbi:hypothetical protein [Methylobacterium sp. Gmos1]
MDRPTDDVLDTLAAHLNRDGIVDYADLVAADDAADLSMPALSAALRGHGYRGADLQSHKIETETDTIAIAYDLDRFRSDRSAEAAWTALRREARRQRVERRVEDWLRRLDDLKAQIGRWTADDPLIEIVDRPPVPMNEDLMREYGVEARAMPSFDVLSQRRRAVRCQPKGLWTLGGNGRVDLVTPASALILVDRSEPLSSPPRWTVYRPRDRTRGVSFDGEVFRHVVETGDLP